MKGEMKEGMREERRRGRDRGEHITVGKFKFFDLK